MRPVRNSPVCSAQARRPAFRNEPSIYLPQCVCVYASRNLRRRSSPPHPALFRVFGRLARVRAREAPNRRRDREWGDLHSPSEPTAEPDSDPPSHPDNARRFSWFPSQSLAAPSPQVAPAARPLEFRRHSRAKEQLKFQLSRIIGSGVTFASSPEPLAQPVGGLRIHRRAVGIFKSWSAHPALRATAADRARAIPNGPRGGPDEIGRASCRERV